MENNFQFASAAISDRGLSDKRPQNEDSYLELRKNGVFAVADGVGGAQAGDVASQMAVEILGEAFIHLPNDVDAEDLMKVAIERANTAIFQMSSELPQLASMATTIVALHLSGNIATIGHVGDSRVYRIDPDGTLYRETADHSVVEEEVRAGRMTPEQALTHPSRNVISRALGAESTVDVEMKTIMVDPGTMFLLCSDGITRHIDDAELTNLFNTEIEPEVLCEQMKEICFSRGAEDNLTAIVVRISSELAGSFAAAASAATGPAPDIEEETIATARSPFERTIAESETIEIPAVESQAVPELAESLDDIAKDNEAENAFLLEDADDLYADEPATPGTEPYASSSVVVPAQAPAQPPTDSVARDTPTFSYGSEPATAGGTGKVLRSFLLFLLGGVLGFGGYYFWQQANPVPEVPVLNTSKSNNIPLTAFEEGRREVDRDPARYLAANAASPQDAEDHFLLGRALLITGKYVEAKRQFTLAKERIGQVDPANAKTLAAEISMGIAIADNPTVAEAFARDLTGGVPGANTDVNSSVNANSPIR